MLGKGQAGTSRKKCLLQRRRNIFSRRIPTQRIKTPFIGEAIIRLSETKFEEIVIIGTQESQWDILYYLNSQNNEIEKNLDLIIPKENKNIYTIRKL